jgi:hypothetical protein
MPEPYNFEDLMRQFQEGFKKPQAPRRDQLPPIIQEILAINDRLQAIGKDK